MVTYLVGTCHADLKGPERLQKFLGFVRPSSICHEGSKEISKRLFEQRRKGLEAFLQMISHPDPALKLAAILEFTNGYEIWAPYHHQQECNPTVRIYPLENQIAYEQAIKVWTNLVGKENIYGTASELKLSLNRALSRGDRTQFQKSIDQIYSNSELFDSEIRSLKRNIGERDYILEERDKPMEQKIREVVAKDAEGTTVAICGAGHIFGAYHNLYERLKDTSPCRIKLPEVDKF